MFKKSYLSALLLFSWALYGAAIVEESPLGSIEGEISLLNRPEGIAFSPSGDCLAIASFHGNQVLFFRTFNSSQPIFVLNLPTGSLQYLHDVAFSPDGDHFAIACRYSNKVMVFKKNASGFYDEEPFVEIKGSSAKLKGINAIKYHPNGKFLGVCDLPGNKIALYRYSEDSYEKLPCQIIRSSRNTLNGPDGLAFSSDGNLLAVTSHENNSLLIFESIPGMLGQYSARPVEVLKWDPSTCCYPHSTCFHPIDDTLVVSFAGGRKTLALFKKQSDTLPRYSPVPSQALEIYNSETIHLQRYAREEGGIKGVAFSPDGKIVGVCSSDIANSDRAILFYPVEF